MLQFFHVIMVFSVDVIVRRYEAKLPPNQKINEQSAQGTLEQFIRDKYDGKRWLDASAVPGAAPSAAPTQQFALNRNSISNSRGQQQLFLKRPSPTSLTSGTLPRLLRLLRPVLPPLSPSPEACWTICSELLLHSQAASMLLLTTSRKPVLPTSWACTSSKEWVACKGSKALVSRGWEACRVNRALADKVWEVCTWVE
jgi:hypothetical protein